MVRFRSDTRARRRLPLVVGGALTFVLTAGAALAASVGVSSTTLTAVRYPASISPTTCTLTAANADSWVNEASTGTNYGTATNLDVRSSFLGDRRTLVRFDLSPCGMPANALVTAASLRLYLYSAPSQSRTYVAHRVTSAWTESGVTWSSQPTVAASATAATTTGTTSNVTVSWTVTTDIQAFVDGTTNLGWRIWDQAENSTVARLGQFRSAEHGTAAQRPVLAVTYYP